MTGTRLRLFLTFFFFSFFLVPLFGEQPEAQTSIKWFSEGMPTISASWGLALPVRRDLRNPTPAEEFICAADFGELKLDSGFKYQCNQLDLTNRISYTPTFFNTFQAGFGCTWHFYRYFKEFTENDLLFTTQFRWIKGPVFSLENAWGVLFKFAAIDQIRSSRPAIFNYSYHFDLTGNWHLFQKSNLWCSLKLQDFFDYPLAISTFLKFGYNYSVNPNILLGADFTLKFVDMFYSAVYLNESVLRITFKVVI